MSETILEEAARITATERQKDYGHPADDFARTAEMWSAIVGKRIRKEHVPLMMIALKLSREVHLHKRDNLVDIAGYARTLEMVTEVGE